MKNFFAKINPFAKTFNKLASIPGRADHARMKLFGYILIAIAIPCTAFVAYAFYTTTAALIA